MTSIGPHAKLGLAVAISALSPMLLLAAPLVEVLDIRHDPAGTFLAYTEFELSGEPLAEALGLDLDVLDPDAVDAPTRFDYIAGIESYEYSEEGMYALNYQSRMGPHLVNGLRNQARGGGMAALGQRFTELAASVRYPVAEIPLNLYPLAWPYRLGSPELAGAADVAEVNRDGDAIIPTYYRDYASLGWDPSAMVKEAAPAALAGLLLKEVMWSQDFLGGMHTVAGDEEVEATSADQDADGEFALGVSSVDGLNGVILTEQSLEKLQVLLTQMTYNGTTLGVDIGPGYTAEAPVWFPHRLAVEAGEKQGVTAINSLSVLDDSARLRDTWMLLWPASELLAFTDQRSVNTGQNPAFQAVFDGAPFAPTPAENRDADANNDVFGTDAFSLANTLARVNFRNLKALHFNASANTLVDEWNGAPGDRVTTYDAAYALVALSVFQKAQDALPVGYAGGDASEGGLNSALGQEALALLRTQADFVLAHLIGANGLAYDQARVDGKAVGSEGGQSLETQFALIRGLGAAFSATNDRRYREAARRLFVAVERKQFDNALGTWASVPGEATEHTPFTAAAISGGLRTALLQLRNEGAEQVPELEVAHLVERYSDWFRLVINGGATDQGMQLAEWLGDSGEHLYADGDGDEDDDQVLQLGKAGHAMVLANRVRVTAGN